MTHLQTQTSKEVAPGITDKPGVHVSGDGVSFSVFSRDAEQMWLDLFDASGTRSDRVRMHRSGDLFHVFVAGLRSGATYGYRAVGPYEPARGLRFNHNKLLIDPYARLIDRDPVDRDGLLRGSAFHGDRRERMDRRDSEPVAPRSIVWDEPFDWDGDRRPAIREEDLVIYETHLRGFTAHPGSGVRHPGTYAGFMEKLDHLLRLGINAVEFLPLQQHATPRFLLEHGLTDYWGYNPIAFFAPERRYAHSDLGGVIDQVKTLIRDLHRAGIAVILDVVYNHTGEGDHTGPTLCYRGLDNRSYYLLEGGAEGDLSRYRNSTGALNTVNAEEPRVRQLILDSLRYWVTEMHVDGFRFDLAPVLGLEGGRFSRSAPFFREIESDPVLKDVLLIAEPWAPSGYELGGFSPRWKQWNDRFRDAVRHALRGDPVSSRELGNRISGSADILGREPSASLASVNFVTCHDGFTLNDLYSYDRKHNHANRENGRDGSDTNLSWNCGVEGPARDPEVTNLRRRLAKTAFACLAFSHGIPMILGGDEMLRTQRGNNNAYCQDNTVSWFDWGLAGSNEDFLRFVRRTLAFRARRPELARQRSPEEDSGLSFAWHDESGPMALSDRRPATALAWKMSLTGSAEALFFLLNLGAESRRFSLPETGRIRWRRVADTSLAPPQDFLREEEAVPLDPADSYWATARSLVVLLGF